MKLQVILVQVKAMIIKSYSHRIDEIAADFSNSLGT